MSRVYLGVHFAGDIVVGALIGAAVIDAARRLLGNRLAAGGVASFRR